jgi:hypothetical protein
MNLWFAQNAEISESAKELSASQQAVCSIELLKKSVRRTVGRPHNILVLKRSLCHHQKIVGSEFFRLLRYYEA